MTKTEIATDIVAAAAIASPWWLKTLQVVHDGAAFALPILGAGWLLLQAFTHIRKHYWKRP
jgi:hypothetical protein